jgi:outer membrane biosynthesis protein TonB
MAQSGVAARPWRTLAPCLALSLVLHGIAWFWLGPAGFPASERGAAGAASELSVTLVSAAAPAPATETAALPVPRVAPAAPVPAVEPPAPKPLPPATAAGTSPAVPAAPTVPPAPSAAGLSGVVSGPWYYAARYLHRRATPLRPIRPDYPPLFGDVAGHVVLLLFINEQGGVDTYRIESAEPAQIFDDAVLRAFVKERYAPGLITGYPVKSQLLVEVSFQPGSEPVTGILLDSPR